MSLNKWYFNCLLRKPIGELNVVLGLEDLGPVSREHLQAHMSGSEVGCLVVSLSSLKVHMARKLAQQFEIFLFLF